MNPIAISILSAAFVARDLFTFDAFGVPPLIDSPDGDIRTVISRRRAGQRESDVMIAREVLALIPQLRRDGNRLLLPRAVRT